MPTGKSCIVCKHTKAVDPTVHMHRIPKVMPLMQQWLEALGIEETDLPKDPRVYSRHFSDGDATKLPSLTLGKKFASSKKQSVPVRIPLPPTKKCKVISSISITSSCESHTVLSTDTSKLLSTSSSIDDAFSNSKWCINEMLESENAALKQKVSTTEKAPFRLEDVMHGDNLAKCTLVFHHTLQCYWWYFMIFLGPAVNNLN